ncbi:CMP-N,N'-diacetyllegionaminic acid synthase [Rubripirellula lacrimiformis]|uniref:CMP-N,N'-diacetyllegionaminic acid synthase n=1 Tax=Rubripirellula lacrimiformis TaxID=1930273 RepID=A0A517N8R4_9BACT|nr:acylneuraminate cytidylyltransferase family protein [Rubripirellula lacrimiformis]QDT03502.1 CMP-N,N'-diacetyllegionaminic acid synthase [Rubripirellula lacrimiformis]
MKYLGIIPARGGSKGIIQKNLQPLGGRPLIAWTIDAANACRELDHVIVSTDCQQIADTARSFGADVPFMRPPELSTDTATSFDAVCHAVDNVFGYDAMVLLQPTSPLRSATDLSHAIQHFESSGASSLVSVCPASKHPNWMKTIDANGKLHAYQEQITATRRQDLKPVYALNGAIYISKIDAMRSSGSIVTDDAVAFVMPPDKSHDIDTEIDLKICEMLLRHQQSTDDRPHPLRPQH